MFIFFCIGIEGLMWPGKGLKRRKQIHSLESNFYSMNHYFWSYLDYRIQLGFSASGLNLFIYYQCTEGLCILVMHFLKTTAEAFFTFGAIVNILLLNSSMFFFPLKWYLKLCITKNKNTVFLVQKVFIYCSSKCQHYEISYHTRRWQWKSICTI